jgi:uncharacterized protein YpuA (DUF1002 family)
MDEVERSSDEMYTLGLQQGLSKAMARIKEQIAGQYLKDQEHTAKVLRDIHKWLEYENHRIWDDYIKRQDKGEEDGKGS